MSNNLGKRLHSPEQQGSVKRPNQDHDSQPVFQLEQAKQLFRRAEKDDQLHAKMINLPPAEDLQACYTPVFKELARIIIGREDIPLPSEDDYGDYFLITTEGEKRRQQEQQKYELGPNIRPAVKAAWKTDYVGNADDLLQGAVDSMFIGSRDKDYANFCAIIQGSGTGKSRLVDKLAESVFTIPIILRPSDDDSGA
ncbi:hypothetical protein C0995_009604 [Termitomyces sp. Mi166|nr:hypothetical protein C0995_009604 [Termitomyces sp. Mi166\